MLPNGGVACHTFPSEHSNARLTLHSQCHCRGWSARAGVQHAAGRPAGCCCVMQCTLPPPRRMSRVGTCTTLRSGKAASITAFALRHVNARGAGCRLQRLRPALLGGFIGKEGGCFPRARAPRSWRTDKPLDHGTVPADPPRIRFRDAPGGHDHAAVADVVVDVGAGQALALRAKHLALVSLRRTGPKRREGAAGHGSGPRADGGEQARASLGLQSSARASLGL